MKEPLEFFFFNSRYRVIETITVIKMTSAKRDGVAVFAKCSPTTSPIIGTLIIRVIHAHDGALRRGKNAISITRTPTISFTVTDEKRA